MKKHLMLLINPVAGKGGYKNGFCDIIEHFYASGWLPTIFFTSCTGDGTQLAAQYASRYGTIVCVGGDGTLSETVSGLMTLDDPPPLGYIPMGTANDFASTLSIPKIAMTAAKKISSGKATPIDIGAFGEECFFTYIAAFGAFTEVSYETNPELKQTLGHVAYVIDAMGRLPKLGHYNTIVEYDGGVIEDDLAFGAVTNSTSLGGLLKLDGELVDLNDGVFEVILVRNPKNVAEMNTLLFEYYNKKYDGQMLTVLHSKRVKFKFEEPVAWTRDGENGGSHTEILLENRHNALNIIL